MITFSEKLPVEEFEFTSKRGNSLKRGVEHIF